MRNPVIKLCALLMLIVPLYGLANTNDGVGHVEGAIPSLQIPAPVKHTPPPAATQAMPTHQPAQPQKTDNIEQPTDKNIIIGRVENVFSGDVVTVIVGQYRAYVRLAGINAPDPQQPFGRQSQAILQKMVGDKLVVMRKTGVDKCGRLIVLMWLKDEKGLDISSRLIQVGSVWVYHIYTKNDYLIKLEQQARNNRLGLWALPDDQRQPPWEWRKQAHFKGIVPVDDCRNKQMDDSESLMFQDKFLWEPPEFSLNEMMKHYS